MTQTVYIFDLDDTLVPTQEAFSHPVARQLLNALNYPPPNPVGEPPTRAQHTQNTYNRILAQDPKLIHLLQRLAGFKYIFTNGTRLHAHCALHSAGIASLFHGQLDRNGMSNMMKPEPATFHLMNSALVAGHTVQPNVVFLDDQLINVKQAKQAGWFTVWIHPTAIYRPLPHEVDLGFESVYVALEFLIKSQMYSHSQGFD
jgi:HAD superfamily hydrolase (TIGR01509 family)